MAFIFETSHFIVEAHDNPEVDRLDGGHIKITPKKEYVDRTQLSPLEAIELMRLTMLIGEAMKWGLEKQGIQIGRINYQDNGNWKPSLHIHLYGRALGAQFQKFGNPIIPWHREEYQPLNNQDIFFIQEEIKILLKQKRFSKQYWNINF